MCSVCWWVWFFVFGYVFCLYTVHIYSHTRVTSYTQHPKHISRAHLALKTQSVLRSGCCVSVCVCTRARFCWFPSLWSALIGAVWSKQPYTKVPLTLWELNKHVARIHHHISPLRFLSDDRRKLALVCRSGITSDQSDTHWRTRVRNSEVIIILYSTSCVTTCWARFKRARTPFAIMEKNTTDSMTTVQMKEYAASEIYSTASEAPPVGIIYHITGVLIIYTHSVLKNPSTIYAV